MLSQKLKRMRTDLGTNEDYVCVCLQYPNQYLVSWFSLWIKKKTKQTLTMNKQNSTGNLLIPIRSSSYTLHVPYLLVRVGSEAYTLGEIDKPSSDVVVVGNRTWRKAPSMKMPRSRAMNAHALVLHEKIYVMGGCERKKSANWAEVFDTKTQTWESLPDRGAKLRFSLIKRIFPFEGKIYVIISGKEDMMKKKNYVYNPEEGEWDTIGNTPLSQGTCWIENMMCTCDRSNCYWSKHDELEVKRRVKGLDLLNGYDIVEITHLGGKLVIFFVDRLKQFGPNKKIWCAMIALERRSEDEVWGEIEWTDIVCIVPRRTTFLNSEIARF